MNNVSIKQKLQIRQSHLDLLSPCLERGGNSTNHKGVLAQYLNTNIPSGRILLCHACNNSHCSNPKHLYWGSDKDNYNDAALNKTTDSIWSRMVKKYGLEEAKRIQGKGNKSAGGKANKGKPKSIEHKQKISEGKKRAYALVAERQTHNT